MPRAVAFAGTVAVALAGRFPDAPAAAPYASWAHSHFVWLDSTQSNQANVSELVAGYQKHNITVGAIDIDSGWSTGFNNFVTDTKKFNDLGALITDLHNEGIYTILWATGMVDTDSPNYAEGLSRGYYIRDGFNKSALVKWWHGQGAFLDYSNPEALAWWQAQEANALALGVDGWKLDGTDPYLVELLTPIGHNGYITLSEYQNYYYGGTFNFTRETNGPHCLVWSRPVDGWPVGLIDVEAYLDFSPKYVMFSGWVGDQDPDFNGLQLALINILESAWRNYTNFGSDTGGYRGGVRTTDLFVRWAQLNAFLPLFENGGNNDHTPWSFDTPGSTAVTDIYRALVASHYELGPYLLATGTAAYAAGVSSITPTSKPPVNFPGIIEPDRVKDWSFRLGNDYFVSPIVAANTTSVRVTLPGPATDSWFEYFDPAAPTHAGGSTFRYATPLTVSPVFGRTGTLLPLHVSTPLGLVPHGDRSWATSITLLLHSPRPGGHIPPRSVHEWGNVSGTVVECEFRWQQRCAGGATTESESGMAVLRCTVAPYARGVILVVRGVPIALGSFNASVVYYGPGEEAMSPLTLPRAADPSIRSDSAFATAAVSWDAAGPAPVHPVLGLKESLAAAAAAEPRSWSYLAGLRARGAGVAMPATGVPEIVVRLGSVAGGASVELTGFMPADTELSAESGTMNARRCDTTGAVNAGSNK